MNNQKNNEIQNKNKALAIYLMENKDLRPLQNVRNFFGFGFLLKADEIDIETCEYKNIEDTFYK